MIHLHNHSEYSLLDGAIKVEDLAIRAAALGQPAVALTDHGVLHGAIPFYKACKEAGVKPIIGVEAYMVYGFDNDVKKHRSTSHITLLAQNIIGYHSLLKLVSWSHLHGFYYKPRITKEMLKQYSDGLICLSGCIQGEINHLILHNDYDGAIELAEWYKFIFGDRFFIEMHDHGLDDEIIVRPGLSRLASMLDIKVVATNDCHFLRKEDHAAHDILLCIGKNQRRDDPNHMEYSPELYFKSRQEMDILFYPDALNNTILVGEMVEDYGIAFGDIKYPHFPIPENWQKQEYLEALCFEGLERRYDLKSNASRLQYELDVIAKTGFVDYFLIVWDLIKYAKENSIPVGPGRGSAAGSLVSYCLGITDVDPIRFGLIFERFLNPDRISPPDIDIDFCMDRRADVIDYVRKKYGETCVAQIITFGTLGARSVIRDTARVLGWEIAEADKLAKMIPDEVGITLEQSAIKEKDIRQMLENGHVAQMWQHARKLEGLSRHAGVHAAGVVISGSPLDEIIPLCLSKEKEVLSQYDMKVLGDLGLLKMDFLGLKTLTVIDKCVQLVKKRVPEFDITKIPDNDQTVFDIYNRGETLGVFQMESGGITSCCKRWTVTTIDDIVAIGAIYRPGPMQFIDEYIDRKHGIKEVEYAHPLLKEACHDTFGIMIYQEQVMKAATLLAGYTLGESDLLRRAMGKKDKKKMEKEHKRFVKGCRKVNDIPENQAEEIFQFISRFAEYGFNKSHAAAYGWISYQTAYLKAHFPVEFMTAMLIHDAPDIERLSQVIAECKSMKIKILPPDVNESGSFFTPTHEGIRFGLSSIRDIGDSAIQKISVAREMGPFTSLADFFTRVDKRVGKRISDAFVKSGAFDSFGSSRSQLLEDANSALGASRSARKDRIEGQVPLFACEVTMRPTAQVEAWPRHEQLAYEKDFLGYYVSGHPLNDYLGYFDSPKVSDIESTKKLNHQTNIRLVGVINSVMKKYTKTAGKPFLIVQIEDFTGMLDIFVWDDVYNETKTFWKVGVIVGVRCMARPKEDRVLVSVQKVAQLRPWNIPCSVPVPSASIHPAPVLAQQP